MSQGYYTQQSYWMEDNLAMLLVENCDTQCELVHLRDRIESCNDLRFSNGIVPGGNCSLYTPGVHSCPPMLSTVFILTVVQSYGSNGLDAHHNEEECVSLYQQSTATIASSPHFQVPYHNLIVDPETLLLDSVSGPQTVLNGASFIGNVHAEMMAHTLFHIGHSPMLPLFYIL